MSDMKELITLGDTDNYLEGWYRCGEFYIEITNDWAGCTETGFGQTTSLNLDRKQALDLICWLTNYINE